MKESLKKIIAYQKSAKDRASDGVFVIEGKVLLSECPKDRLVFAVASERFVSEEKESYAALSEKLSGIPTEIVPDWQFARLSDTSTPAGILAVVRRKPFSLSEITEEPDGLYVVSEDIRDPGNLGTILRSMEAAGATALILNATSVDPYHPKVVRSTMGSIFRVPVVTVTDLRETVRILRERGVVSYAASLQAETDYDSADYRKGTAFLIGNEAHGLSRELTEEADMAVRIPMKGQVESLNAAMAAVILLFEAARVRRGLT